MPKSRRPFKQQILDLLLRIDVPAGTAVEVANEVIRKSTSKTPMETIRIMILDSLRKRDAVKAEKLEERFERIQLILNQKIGPQAELSGEIYDEETSSDLLEADEITAAELYFMEGREGRPWLRKTAHHDSTSTAMTSEDRFED